MLSSKRAAAVALAVAGGLIAAAAAVEVAQGPAAQGPAPPGPFESPAIPRALLPQSLQDASCVCPELEKDGHAYIRWIAEFFHDCVYTSTEVASFFCGLATTLIWFIAQLPQICKNFHNREVDGLSKWLLIIWLAGDATNLLGSILTDALKTQIITGYYFCMINTIMVVQHAYYTLFFSGLRRNAQPGESRQQPASRTTRFRAAAGIFTMVSLLISLMIWDHSRSPPPTLSPDLVASCESSPNLSPEIRVLGSVISWCSGMLYFLCRIPQILENYRRKSVLGLSLAMFGFAIAANVSYGTSIVLRLPAVDASFWSDKFPFLLGSFGTLIFDIIIMIQAAAYGFVAPAAPGGASKAGKAETGEPAAAAAAAAGIPGQRYSLAPSEKGLAV